MAKMKAKKKVSHVRLKHVLKALTIRRARATRKLRMTQAEYAVAVDKTLRAIVRSQAKGSTMVLKSVLVW